MIFVKTLSFPNLEEGERGQAYFRATSYCLGNSAKKKKKNLLKITSLKRTTACFFD